MMRALAQIDHKVEIHAAARAHEHRGRPRLQARPVRGDQHIRLQRVLLRLEERAEAGRAGFLARLDHDAAVEAQPTAHRQNRLERGDVDQVLALVVGGPASIEPVALLDQPEGMQARAPLIGLGADHVAMPVTQDRGQALVLDPRSHEDGPRPRDGVRMNAAREAQFSQTRDHRLVQIAGQLGRLGAVLAFGLEGHQRAQVVLEAAVVEIGRNGVDGGGSCHVWLRCLMVTLA